MATQNESEFDFYLRFAKPLVLNLAEPKDRVLAAAWIQKLRDPEVGSERLRSDYLKLLLFVLQRKRLARPFCEPPHLLDKLQEFPSTHRLQDVAKDLIESEAKDKQGFVGPSGDYPPFTTEYSADLLEYAAAQDIPHFGVHVYYAISPQPLPFWDKAEKGVFPKTTVLNKADQKSEFAASSIVSLSVSRMTVRSKSRTKSKTRIVIEKETESKPKARSRSRSRSTRRSECDESSRTIQPAPVVLKKKIKPPVEPLGVPPSPVDRRNPPIWGSNLIEVIDPPNKEDVVEEVISRVAVDVRQSELSLNRLIKVDPSTVRYDLTPTSSCCHPPSNHSYVTQGHERGAERRESMSSQSKRLSECSCRGRDHQQQQQQQQQKGRSSSPPMKMTDSWDAKKTEVSKTTVSKTPCGTSAVRVSRSITRVPVDGDSDSQSSPQKSGSRSRSATPCPYREQQSKKQCPSSASCPYKEQQTKKQCPYSEQQTKKQCPSSTSCPYREQQTKKQCPSPTPCPYRDKSPTLVPCNYREQQSTTNVPCPYRDQSPSQAECRKPVQCPYKTPSKQQNKSYKSTSPNKQVKKSKCTAHAPRSGYEYDLDQLNKIGITEADLRDISISFKDIDVTYTDENAPFKDDAFEEEWRMQDADFDEWDRQLQEMEAEADADVAGMLEPPKDDTCENCPGCQSRTPKGSGSRMSEASRMSTESRSRAPSPQPSRSYALPPCSPSRSDASEDSGTLSECPSRDVECERPEVESPWPSVVDISAAGFPNRRPGTHRKGTMSDDDTYSQSMRSARSTRSSRRQHEPSDRLPTRPVMYPPHGSRNEASYRISREADENFNQMQTVYDEENSGEDDYLSEDAPECCCTFKARSRQPEEYASDHVEWEDERYLQESSPYERRDQRGKPLTQVFPEVTHAAEADRFFEDLEGDVDELEDVRDYQRTSPLRPEVLLETIRSDISDLKDRAPAIAGLPVTIPKRSPIPKRLPVDVLEDDISLGDMDTPQYSYSPRRESSNMYELSNTQYDTMLPPKRGDGYRSPQAHSTPAPRKATRGAEDFDGEFLPMCSFDDSFQEDSCRCQDSSNQKVKKSPSKQPTRCTSESERTSLIIDKYIDEDRMEFVRGAFTKVSDETMLRSGRPLVCSPPLPDSYASILSTPQPCFPPSPEPDAFCLDTDSVEQDDVFYEEEYEQRIIKPITPCYKTDICDESPPCNLPYSPPRSPSSPDPNFKFTADLMYHPYSQPTERMYRMPINQGTRRGNRMMERRSPRPTVSTVYEIPENLDDDEMPFMESMKPMPGKQSSSRLPKASRTPGLQSVAEDGSPRSSRSTRRKDSCGCYGSEQSGNLLDSSPRGAGNLPSPMKPTRSRSPKKTTFLAGPRCITDETFDYDSDVSEELPMYTDMPGFVCGSPKKAPSCDDAVPRFPDDEEPSELEAEFDMWEKELAALEKSIIEEKAKTPDMSDGERKYLEYEKAFASPELPLEPRIPERFKKGTCGCSSALITAQNQYDSLLQDTPKQRRPATARPKHKSNFQPISPGRPLVIPNTSTTHTTPRRPKEKAPRKLLFDNNQSCLTPAAPVQYTPPKNQWNPSPAYSPKAPSGMYSGGLDDEYCPGYQSPKFTPRDQCPAAEATDEDDDESYSNPTEPPSPCPYSPQVKDNVRFEGYTPQRRGSDRKIKSSGRCRKSSGQPETVVASVRQTEIIADEEYTLMPDSPAVIRRQEKRTVKEYQEPLPKLDSEYGELPLGYDDINEECLFYPPSPESFCATECPQRTPGKSSASRGYYSPPSPRYSEDNSYVCPKYAGGTPMYPQGSGGYGTKGYSSSKPPSPIPRSPSPMPPLAGASRVGRRKSPLGRRMNFSTTPLGTSPTPPATSGQSPRVLKSSAPACLRTASVPMAPCTQHISQGTSSSTDRPCDPRCKKP